MEYIIGGLIGLALGIIIMYLINLKYQRATIFFLSLLSKGQGIRDHEIQDIKKLYGVKC